MTNSNNHRKSKAWWFVLEITLCRTIAKTEMSSLKMCNSWWRNLVVVFEWINSFCVIKQTNVPTGESYWKHHCISQDKLPENEKDWDRSYPYRVMGLPNGDVTKVTLYILKVVNISTSQCKLVLIQLGLEFKQLWLYNFNIYEDKIFIRHNFIERGQLFIYCYTVLKAEGQSNLYLQEKTQCFGVIIKNLFHILCFSQT